MFSNILCSIDGSDHAEKALELAIDLASKYQAKLHLIHVLHRDANIDQLQRYAEIEGLAHRIQDENQRINSMDVGLALNSDSVFEDPAVSPRLLMEIGEHILKSALEKAEDAGLTGVTHVLENGDPASQIVAKINSSDIDCVVMGSRGLSDWKGMLMGSVSHKVSNQANCTCIAVK